MRLVGLAMILILVGCDKGSQEDKASSQAGTNHQNETTMTYYDFKVNDLSGAPVDLSRFKGKKILVVNTASECGLTPQYAQLQELYDSLGGDEFTIVGFPSNDFGGQEPLSNSEIAPFCTANYGVTFPMMEKTAVLGDQRHPLFQWMVDQERAKEGMQEFEVLWNFHKFLIDEQGNYVGQLHPEVLPLDEQVINWIKD